MAETAAGKEMEAWVAARQTAKTRAKASMSIEVTVGDVTVEDLHHQLGKLVDIGWGKAAIDWHTSRSHIGKQITMSLAIEGDDS